MIRIDYPSPAFRIEKRSGVDFIFDTFRKRWLKLSPEEWVRQNFLQYMTVTMNYPSTLIAVEKEIMLGELTKRFDILLYDSMHQPWLIVECKAMSVALTDDVLQQVLRYSIPVPAQYLVITNGSYTTGWKKENGGLTLLQQLPIWP
ncbi:MAG: type I restriction enzyme HsdR N-terminal domain-containing protein [Chitinophagaceae bacterium]|nr:type I restriction enzyme HsdR N-terminal domain-containing protein [Chitinophagaceae bacterium]